VNIDQYVNVKRAIERFGSEAGVRVDRDSGDDLLIRGPGMSYAIEFKVLRRPTPSEVHESAAPRRLLVLVEPNRAAREAAASVNHVTLPNGGLRLVLPGLVLVAGEDKPEEKSTAVRLKGASGVVAETMLLHPEKEWTMRELADRAHVSLGLAQRVAERLQREEYVKRGSAKGRVLVDSDGLVRLWAQENGAATKPFAKTFLYARNPIEAVRSLAVSLPGVCIGGALAGNTYVSRLSTVPPPYRIWVPRELASIDTLRRAGLDPVGEGANFEFHSIVGDVWKTHSQEASGVLRVSRPRAYVELYNSRGRLQELAEALLKEKS